VSIKQHLLDSISISAEYFDIWNAFQYRGNIRF